MLVVCGSQFSSFYLNFFCYICKLAGEIVLTKAELNWLDFTLEKSISEIRTKVFKAW